MFSRQELYKTPEFWMERIQNDLFRALHQYKEEKALNQTQLAEHLGFSKGYISQVLNGNFNYSLKKLIDLSLAVGVVPDLEFKHIQDFIDMEEKRLDHLKNYGFAKIDNLNANATVVIPLNTDLELSKLMG